MIVRPELLDHSISLTREAALDLCKYLELSDEEQQKLGQKMLLHQSLDRLQRAIKMYNQAWGENPTKERL